MGPKGQIHWRAVYGGLDGIITTLGMSGVAGAIWDQACC